MIAGDTPWAGRTLEVWKSVSRADERWQRGSGESGRQLDIPVSAHVLCLSSPRSGWPSAAARRSIRRGSGPSGARVSAHSASQSATLYRMAQKPVDPAGGDSPAIHFRIPARDLQRLERLAARRGVHRTEALRALLVSGLDAEGEARAS